MKRPRFTDQELDALSEVFENLDPDQFVLLSKEECQITRALISQASAQNDLVQAIQDARNAGVSWAKVAKLIGVTPQAAHKRYAPLMSDNAKAS